MEEIYKELEKAEEETFEKILSKMLESDKNLPLKTHIVFPHEISVLSVIAEKLENDKFLKSASLLKIYIQKYIEYMVSYKRLSREEIVRAFVARTQSEESTKEARIKRLLGL